MFSIRLVRTVVSASLVVLLGGSLVAATTRSPAAAQSGKTVRRTGGVAVAHRDGKAIKASNRPTTLTNWVEMTSGEPTLGLTSDGDIFFSAISTNTRVEVMHSKNGKRWDIRSPKLAGVRNAHLVTFDPYVYVDRDTDRVFTIDLTVACSYLSFSDDKGESWITNPLACGRPVNDHQTLFTGPPASSPMTVYPNIVYYCWNDVASSACSKSLDGGLTFHPTGSPAFQGYDPDQEDGIGVAGLCGGLHGHGVVDKEGAIYLPREYCGNPWLAISRDEGLTWERMQVSNLGVHGFGAGADNPDVAVDAKGNIYYSWIGADRYAYLTVSTNGGKKWSRPVKIAPPGVTEANLTTIDVGDPGKVAIAYMASTNSPYRRCKANCEGGDYAKTSWNGYITMSTNALAKDPVFYTGTINPPSDPIKRGTCGPGRCGTVVYDFIDVFIGPDGIPYASFVDACTGICAQGTGGADAGNEGLFSRLVGGPKLRSK